MTDEDKLIAELGPRAQAAAVTWRPTAEITRIEPLTGGTSSLTFTAWLDGTPDHDRLVLKVAPPGLAPVRNRDVLRQGKLMRALHGQPGVQVPPVFFEDAGTPPDIPPFIAMGFVPGECIEPALLPDRDPARFADIRSRAFSAAVMLAHLHQVDPVSCGLGDEPVVTITDEIQRWTTAFETLPEDLQGDYVRVGERLRAAIPAPMDPVVNHGDYRLGNTLSGDGKVHAIIDWEIFSIGDPRVDLTWFTFFTDEAKAEAAALHGPSGMPTAAELLDAYADAGGTPPADFAYFEALTRYKEAAATGLLVKRARKLGRGEQMANMAPQLAVWLQEADEILG
jgi:aminoglycoside phosphotransferase (APT) family kinase protein